MRYLAASLFCLGVGAGLLGCSSSAADDGSYSGTEGPRDASGSGDGAAVGSGTGGGSVTAPGVDSGATGSGGGAGTVSGGMAGAQPEPGLLTAGVWDDHLNFERFLGYRSGLVATRLPGILPVSEKELDLAQELWLESPPKPVKLDVSLIIDTTGSMGDEIAYLQTEFSTISKTIAKKYPNSQQRWSLVLYRDLGDDYVSRAFDFDDDAGAFREHLAAQGPGGGGDFPEAPERGFGAAAQLDWRLDAETARLAFWVADAPHHESRATEMAESLRGMKELGVHVYPVASSGVDELTELSMRTAALLTGGRYVFLTNDSGIGGDHKEPTIPCYFVTKLDDALLRMVDVELSGVYREPDASEIIRTGGNPKDGSCQLESGETVFVY